MDSTDLRVEALLRATDLFREEVRQGGSAKICDVLETAELFRSFLAGEPPQVRMVLE